MNARPYSLLLGAGVVALAAGTLLHPMGEDPNEAVKAFAEYAADQHWLASHMFQLAGVLLLVLGLLGVLHAAGTSGALMVICTALGASTIAVSCALQAVDGIALKFMVDRWAASASMDKDAMFNAAYAVRTVEFGLAAMASIVTGVTIAVSGLSLFMAGFGRELFLGTGLTAGVLFVASGLVIGTSGFSGLSMTINISASVILMIWIVSVLVMGWRRSPNMRGGN
jgi:hypothetical protein